MAIRKRGDSWQIDYLDPGGKRVRQSFKTRKEAAAELGKRVSLIAEGRYLDVKPECKTTLAELCKRYEENFSPQRSFQNKGRYLENFKEYFGADTLLDNIRFVHLETYRNTLKSKPVTSKRKKVVIVRGFRKDASINRELACLHHLFKKAVEWQLLERSPFERGQSLILKENNKRLRFLNGDEIQLLLGACLPHLRPVVETAILTGMRRGEILSLKWDQIRSGFIYLEKTKTNEARQIPVSDALEAVFKDIRRKEGLKYEYVFSYQGKPIADNIKHSFNSAVKKAGIVDFHFHDLRHTFASQVLLHGGTLKDVQELLGHKSLAMTLRYAHLTQESKKKAVNLLNGLTAKAGDCHKNVTFSEVTKGTAAN
ncbi:MAG: site-specific integrase [Desulfobacterales bacterium]|nr:site-specific integrase [Desulfobacterales bacterium]